MTTDFVANRRLDFTDRLIKDQISVIFHLQQQIAEQEQQIRDYQRLMKQIGPKAQFYFDTQRKLVPTPDCPPPDPQVVLAWQTFITMIKLTLSRTVPGLTKA
jgi:hypothetical protein